MRQLSPLVFVACLIAVLASPLLSESRAAPLNPRPGYDQSEADKWVDAGGQAEKNRNDAELARRFRKAAEQGEAFAQQRLGAMYALGKGVPQDIILAYMWLSLSAPQDDESAKIRDLVASKLSPGQLAEAQKLANEWQPKKQDQPWHWLDAGSNAFDKQNYVEAAKLFRMAAAQGNSEAQVRLGSMYANGNGVPLDFVEAMKWIRMAADNGSPNAQFIIGTYYEDGRGVTQSFTDAAIWYRKAATQGYSNAQIFLAALYVGGRGVSINYSEAAKWYKMAADGGSAIGQCMIGKLYNSGRGVPKDYNMAMMWYKKAADQDYAGGQFLLGVSYATGRGVPQNYSEAIKWYRKAAEQGDAEGQAALGAMYASGLGVPPDNSRAYMWLSLAATRGNTNSIEYRDVVASKMSPAQLAEAQKFANEWRPKTK